MTFTVTRSGDASGTTTVAWTTENRTATGGSDFVVASGQLVFDPQVVAQTVTISVLGDTLVEPNEILALRLSNATGGIVADGIGLGTIVNDDVSLSISDATVKEGGSGLRFIDAFVPQQYGGLYDPRGVTVGPDGDIFVASAIAAQVLRFDGASGQFLGVFADASAAGSDARTGTVLFHEGNLYVSTGANNSILRFNGQSGVPFPAPGKSGAEFVTTGDGGLDGAWGMEFGPDGRLYVASALTHEVLVYDGVDGDFDGVFVLAGDQGLNQPLVHRIRLRRQRVRGQQWHERGASLSGTVRTDSGRIYRRLRHSGQRRAGLPAGRRSGFWSRRRPVCLQSRHGCCAALRRPVRQLCRSRSPGRKRRSGSAQRACV